MKPAWRGKNPRRIKVDFGKPVQSILFDYAVNPPSVWGSAFTALQIFEMRIRNTKNEAMAVIIPTMNNCTSTSDNIADSGRKYTICRVMEQTR